MKKRSERGNPLLRSADRWLGIPAVFIAGILRHKGTLPPEIRRIGLLKTAAIGDTVLLSGPIADLRNSFPTARLTLFTGGSNYEMAAMLPVDEVISVAVSDPFEARRQVRAAGRFDAWIDFGPWPRFNALVSYFADAAYKAGFKTPGQYRHYVYDYVVPHSDRCHEIDNYRRLLGFLGVAGKAPPSLAVAATKQVARRAVVHMFPGGYLSHMKEWPEENWVEVLRFLTDNGFEVLLTGGSGDTVRAERVARAVGQALVTVVAGGGSLRDTIELMASSGLVVSVNTGIMHIASALNMNLVALHGPTSPERWGPLNGNSISLVPEIPCAPCLNLGFEYGCRDNSCMRRIDVAKVCHAIERLVLSPDRHVR